MISVITSVKCIAFKLGLAVDDSLPGPAGRSGEGQIYTITVVLPQSKVTPGVLYDADLQSIKMADVWGGNLHNNVGICFCCLLFLEERKKCVCVMQCRYKIPLICFDVAFF